MIKSTNNPTSLQIPTLSDVKTWLKGEGYPFEMQVAKALADIGFRPTQGECWYDKDTEKYYETDIRMQHPFFHVNQSEDIFHINDVLVEIEYTIECKVTIEHPWIVFRKSPPTAPSANAYTAYRAHRWPGTRESREIFDRLLTAPMSDPSIFLGHAFGPDAYGITVYKKQKDPENSKSDLAYSSLMKITKAAHYYLDTIEYNRKSYRIVIPVIIVNGPLYETFVNDSGVLDIYEIENAHINWSPYAGLTDQSEVQLLTDKSYVKYFQDARREIMLLNDYILPFTDFIGADLENSGVSLLGPTFWERVKDPDSNISKIVEKIRALRPKSILSDVQSSKQ